MSKHSVVAFPPPHAASADPLTEVLRQGARRLLAQAIEAEVETLLAIDADVRDERGRQASCEMGPYPNARCKPVSVRSRSTCLGSGIAVARGFDFTPRFYRPI
jgi:hypothetical protein